MSELFKCAAICLAAGGLLFACGCGSEETAPKTGPDPGEAAAASRCDDRFSAAYNQLQPDRLGISANESSALARMNEWLVECAVEDLSDPTFPDQLGASVAPEFTNRLSARRFGQRDIEYVRDCILARSIGTQILDNATDDRQRVVDAFYYVVQHVELLGKPNALLSPFEILLFGQGTAEDRAWVFFEVTHQMHFDTFIVRSATNAEAWLVGVLVEDDVLLFDPRLGIAVPSSDDKSAVPRQPVTLSQAQSDSQVLAGLSVDGFKHPVDGVDLKSPKIELVANSTRWSPRMNVMQAKLSGERSVIVYEPLADDSDFEGTLTRIGKAGGQRWSADDVGLWLYAEGQSERISRRVESDIKTMESEFLRFTAPVSYKPVEKDSVITFEFDSATNGLLKMRIRQLMGEYGANTTADLMRIRDSELPEKLFPATRSNERPKAIPLPDFLKNSNNRAARDALYFIGECQRSRREFDASISTFRNYVRKYPDGERNDASLFLTALDLMTDNQAEVAVRTLDRISGDMKPTAAWFKHRWQGTPAGKANKTATDDRPETPVTDDAKQPTDPEKQTTDPAGDAVDKPAEKQPVEPPPAEPTASADRPK